MGEIRKKNNKENDYVKLIKVVLHPAGSRDAFSSLQDCIVKTLFFIS